MASNTTRAPQRIGWRNLLLTSGVLLILLALSVVAGAVAGSERDMITLAFIAGPAALLSLIVLFQKFEFVVLCLPISALAIPFVVPTGTETKLPVALLLALALCGTWIASMMIRKQWTIDPSPLNRPALAFCTICCISLVWGVVWRDPGLIRAPTFVIVQVASLITILVSFGAAWLIGHFVRTTARLKYIVITFLVCGSLMTLTQLFNISQPFLNDKGLWGMWTVLPAYGLVIAQPNLRWYWRALLLLIIALTLYQTMIVNSFWVSGWLPTVAALFIATFLRSKKAFFVLLIVAVIVGYSTRSFFETVAQDNIDDGSLQRLSLWDQNWRVVRAHWLFGTGPAGYALYYMTYYREDARSTHNNYLDILAQFGFSGMATWIWFAFASIIEGWRLTRRAPPGFLRTLALVATAGWVGSLVSMFFGDWILPFAYNQGVGGYKYTVYSWLFLGTLLSIRAMLPPESAGGGAKVGGRGWWVGYEPSDSQAPNRKSPVFLLCCLAVIAGILAPSTLVIAQSGTWAEPMQISGTTRTSWFPDIAVGRDGSVHIVWASGVDQGEEAANGIDLLLYSVRRDGQWSKPNDIVYTGTGGFASRNSLVMGRDGRLHLLVRNQLKIFYLNAPADQAGSAQDWSPPRRINNRNTPYYDALAMDSVGRLHAFWNETIPDDPKKPRTDCPSCSDLFYRHSPDNGQTWSTPINISESPDGSAKPQVKVAANDVIHLVWDEGKDTIVSKGVPVAGMYRRSRDGGVTWDTPLRFTLPSIAVDVPPTPIPAPDQEPPSEPAPTPVRQQRDAPQQITIGLYQNTQPIVVYRSTASDTLYYQYSRDEGATWSDSARLPGIRARLLNDTPWDSYAMATDGGGNVHLFIVGFRAEDTDPKSKPLLLHLVWDGQRWSQPDVVASNKRLYPEWPRVAIENGNILHVTWFARNEKDIFDSDHSQYQIWYSTKRIDAPDATPLPQFTPVPTTQHPTPTASPTATPIPTLAPSVAQAPVVDGPPDWERRGYESVALALLPLVALFGLAIVVSWMRRR